MAVLRIAHACVERVVTTLLSVTLSYALGLLIGLRVAVPLLSVVAVGVLVLFWRPRYAPWLFVVPGILMGMLRAEQARNDCRVRIADGARITVTGAPLALSVDGTTTLFSASTVRAADGASCAATVVRVRAVAPHLALLDSAALGLVPAVELHGRWLAYPQRSRWTRSPEFAGGLMIDASRSVNHANGGTWFSRFGARQQQRLRALLPERWPLAEALLLAQTRGMDTATRDRWVNAGLVHLLAISGMHVGMIAAVTLLLGTLFGLSRRTSSRLAILCAASYVLFLGAPSAALRSLLQATLLLAALELQRPADPFTSLAASALVILVLEPLALIEPGFQLSFGGILGLMLWRRPMMNALPRRWPRLVRDGLGSGIAASALTTPIAALHFGTASWIGIFGTPLATPVMAAALALLVVALVIAGVTGAVTGVHALAADVPMWLLDRIAAWCAVVPGGHGHMSAFTVFACLLGGAALIVLRRALAVRVRAPASYENDVALHRYLGRRRTRAYRVAMAGAASLMIAAWTPRIIDARGDTLEIHAIDVGQGDAFAIRTPNGRWILVDAGPRTATRDAGRDRVVPFLLRHGVRRIDALILTHPHADHIGGARAVLDVFDVGVVIDPALAFGQMPFLELLEDARGEGQRWIAGRAGAELAIDRVRITILHPFRQLDVSGDPNDLSVVLRLSFGDFDALFTGDAPESVESEIVARNSGRLQAELLKVGHHGSRTSTGVTLLDEVQPSVALVPVGRNNVYRHPSPEVVARLAERGVRVLRTDERGDIAVRAWRDGRFDLAAAR